MDTASNKLITPGFIIFGALTIAGIAVWVYQLMNGLGITGMSNSNSWGLYITKKF